MSRGGGCGNWKVGAEGSNLTEKKTREGAGEKRKEVMKKGENTGSTPKKKFQYVKGNDKNA